MSITLLVLSVLCITLLCVLMCAFSFFSQTARRNLQVLTLPDMTVSLSTSVDLSIVSQRLDAIFGLLSLWKVKFSIESVWLKKKRCVTFVSCNTRHSRYLLSWRCPLTPLCYIILDFPCHLIFTAVRGRQSKWPLSCTNKAHPSGYFSVQSICNQSLLSV